MCKVWCSASFDPQHLWHAHRGSGLACASCTQPTLACTSPITCSHSSCMQRMNELLLQLQMVTGVSPGLVLPELAERVASQLQGVDLCRCVAAP